MRYKTLTEIDEAGFDVRAWCWRCARGGVVPGTICTRFTARGWAGELDAAAQRFRCKGCGRVDAVQLLPARRAPYPPAPPERVRTWADEVAAYFHACRADAKRRRRDSKRR